MDVTSPDRSAYLVSAVVDLTSCLDVALRLGP